MTASGPRDGLRPTLHTAPVTERHDGDRGWLGLPGSTPLGILGTELPQGFSGVRGQPGPWLGGPLLLTASTLPSKPCQV